MVIKRAPALNAGVWRERGEGREEGRGRSKQSSNHTSSTGDVAPDTDATEWRIGTAVGRSDVWFRFKEGVSNAVRRSLYIRDLL